MSADFKGTARFVVQRHLGSGGYGDVYEARDTERGITVALKVLQNVTSESLYCFKREFRSLADVSHRNLVQLYELVSCADKWFFTMELVRGQNLLHHVSHVAAPIEQGGDGPANEPATDEGLTRPMLGAEHAGLSGATPAASAPHGPAVLPVTRVSLDRLVPAFRQLVEGVHTLHGYGHLHRDVKPSNVLVTDGGRVVLLDFGLVVDVDSEATLQSLQVAGTPAYMSPEQAAGLPLTPASDWYSVGVVLYQALTGDVPFAGTFLQVITEKQRTEPPPPASRAVGIPPHLDVLCRDLLRRDQACRPAANEILERLQGGTPTADQRSRVHLGPRHRSQRLVGREEQLANLRRAFETMMAGMPTVATVYGPSGIGKSALVKAFLEELGEGHPDVVVLTGRCYERESVPYKALDSLIDALARHLRRLPEHEVGALLPREIAALAQVFPVLRRFEEQSLRTRRAPEQPDSQELRRRAYLALRELLARLSDKHPLVLFVDDLQWGDVDSALLLSDVLRVPDGPVLMLVAVYRDIEIQTSAFLRSFVPAAQESGLALVGVPVDRLSADESKQLAATLLPPTTPGADEVASVIATEAAGSPFFIDELVRSAERRGRIAAGSMTSGGDTGARDATLAHMIQLRLARLPDEAQLLLRLIAINGRPIPEHVLKLAAGGELPASAVALLRSEHLVRSRETDHGIELEPYHDRIREAVVRWIEGSDAAVCHRRLAEALEMRNVADAELLAEHFRAAGNASRAADYTMIAAREAEHALAFDRAARLYRRMLDLLDSGDAGSAERTLVMTRLAVALGNAGRSAEAASAYLGALPSSPRAALEFKQKAAQHLLFGGRLDEGLAILRDVLAAIGMGLPETRWQTIWALLLGRLRVRLQGLRYQRREPRAVPADQLMVIDACWSVSAGLGLVDTVRGAVFQTRHLLLALRAGEAERVHRALCTEAAFCALRGTRASTRMDRIRASTDVSAQEIGTPYAQAMHLLCGGIADYLLGRWKLAAKATSEAEQLLSDHCSGVPCEVDNARYFSLCARYFLGEIKEISRRFPELMKDAHDRGDLYAGTMLNCFFAHLVFLAADDPAAASRHARDGISSWSQRGFHIQHQWELVASSHIALYEGRGTMAWRNLHQWWPALRSSLLLSVQMTRICMIELLGRAALAAASGCQDPSGRLRMLGVGSKCARRLEGERAPWAVPMALMIRAGVHVSGTQNQLALRLLDRAEHAFGECDMRLHAAVARRRRGELMAGDEGVRLVADSEAWMHEQGIRNPMGMSEMLAPWMSRR